MSKAEWPDMPRPRISDAAIMELLSPVGALYESKSPMKYAVDYKLTDEDGQLIGNTEYFILREDAWERAQELYESESEGTITFREL